MARFGFHRALVDLRSGAQLERSIKAFPRDMDDAVPSPRAAQSIDEPQDCDELSDDHLFVFLRIHHESHPSGVHLGVFGHLHPSEASQ